MEPGIVLISRTICTKHGEFGSSPGCRTANAFTFNCGFVVLPEVGKHRMPATANPVRPEAGIALNSVGCRAIDAAQRLSTVGAWTIGLASVKPSALGSQQPLGAICTGKIPV